MKTKVFGKRKYDKKLTTQALKHKDFIIKHLRQEWDILEKKASKERLLRIIKEGGTTVATITGKALLTLLLVGGTVTIATVAPNILGAIGRTGKRKAYFHKKHIRTEITYLKKQDYIQIKRSKDNKDKNLYEVKPTESGMKRAVAKALGELKIYRPEYWDKFWRIVIFDIPDKHKWARDGLRNRLKALDFYQLQKSVFVFPHPCYDELEFLMSLYNVTDYVRIIETDKIIPDDDLMSYFNLK